MPAFTRPLAALACLLVAGAAAAQNTRGPTPRYQPSTPSLSPYLGLLSNQGGVLPNYYALVRPLQRQSSINAQQTSALRRQAVEIEAARVQFGQAEARSTGTAAWFNNFPQTGSGFSQRSHYYGQWEQRNTRFGRR